MIYTWRCRACAQRIEVQRRVAEYMDPPIGLEAKHGDCTSTDFQKLVDPPSRIFVHENEESYHKRMTEPY